MEINLMDVEKFVKVNPTMIGLVTNPIFLDRDGSPTPDGLLSTQIFGNSTRLRGRRFGYIELGDYYIQPIIYKNIKRLDRRIDGICSGRIKVVVGKDGSIIEDDEKGETGIDFFYKNWDKIKFKTNESAIHNERVSVINSHSRNEVFTNKWLVCPALYRDINMQDVDTRKIGADTINGIYSTLIRYVSMLQQDSSFVPIMHNTRYMIQMTLIEIYDYFKNLIEKKYGLVRKALLGKTVDYGARLVITSPNYNFNSYKDVDIDFRHAGIPLANCCSLFTPFILQWVRNFLQQNLEGIDKKFPFHDKEKITFRPLKDPMSYYNDDMIRHMMETFIYSYTDRFKFIEIPHQDMEKNQYYLALAPKKFGPDQYTPVFNRKMTLTDLFFLAASAVCADKHVYITRYPMTDTMGTFPIGINVLSTHNTMKAEVWGKIYKHYPVIDLNLTPDEVASQFIDTVKFQNIFLKAMNGDYDGDQITVKGVFSQQANKEAEEIMNSKIYVVNMAGQSMRTTTNETIQTLYSLTRFKK